MCQLSSSPSSHRVKGKHNMEAGPLIHWVPANHPPPIYTIISPLSHFIWLKVEPTPDSTSRLYTSGNWPWSINMAFLHVFQIWEKASVPRENPHGHWETMQTPNRQYLMSGLNRVEELWGASMLTAPLCTAWRSSPPIPWCKTSPPCAPIST